MSLRCGDRDLSASRTYVMGVVNVTPDSFSDGGNYLNTDHAVQHALRLLDEGADVLDIGGVATSPKITEIVTLEEELKRVIPVVSALASRGVRNICVDTSRARVAQEALDHGAAWINDQAAGLMDPLMPAVMAKAEGVVIMHHGGGASGVDAGNSVVYTNVIDQLLAFFHERIAVLSAAGVVRERVIVDPGVGFGKGLADSLTIINSMQRFKGVGGMSMLGLSRKSFLYPICGIEEPLARDFASLGADAAAILSGVGMLRTHNVRGLVEMNKVFSYCLFFSGGKEERKNVSGECEDLS